MNNIIRFGVSIDEKLLKRFDTLIEQKGYVNRSEAIRDLIRDMLVQEDTSSPDAEVIGTLTLIYSHHASDLAEKLNDIQHQHYDHIISTVHVHLDEHNCLEVLLLRGQKHIVQKIGDNLLSVKNVRHGKLTITTTGKDLP
ncbi:MAG: nickel-responsive transcriptional regulator NikR [Spirochaetes bacterium]|nr:nickel-responsive transcriptional regulator NikR [Spirochaetota bacterium]